MDRNSQKSITSNENHLTVAISGIIIYEGLYFNIDQKTIFNKVLEFEINFPSS